MEDRRCPLRRRVKSAFIADHVYQLGSFPAPLLVLLEFCGPETLAMTGRGTNHEWQGNGVFGGRATCEHVLDRAGATKLLHW